MGSPTLATLLDEWLDERQSDRGLSPNTEAAYRNDLRVWPSGSPVPVSSRRCSG